MRASLKTARFPEGWPRFLVKALSFLFFVTNNYGIRPEYWSLTSDFPQVQTRVLVFEHKNIFQMVNLLLEIVKSNRQTWEHRREPCFKGLVVFKDETNVHLSPFIFGKKDSHGSGDDRDRDRFPTCQGGRSLSLHWLWQEVSLA